MNTVLFSLGQGDRERFEGLPLSPLCDTVEVRPKAQLGFIDFCVRPCLTPIAAFCKAHGRGHAWTTNINANKREWARLNRLAMAKESAAAKESAKDAEKPKEDSEERSSVLVATDVSTSEPAKKKPTRRSARF